MNRENICRGIKIMDKPKDMQTIQNSFEHLSLKSRLSTQIIKLKRTSEYHKIFA